MTTLHDAPAATRAGLPDVLDEIAADYRRRLRDGGGEPPHAGLELVRRHHLGAVGLAADLGGSGWSVPEFFAFLVDLAAADPDLAHVLRVHYSVVEDLQRAARRRHTGRWLEEVRAGRLIGGTTSEQGNRPVGGQQFDTRLVATPDGPRLRGRKFYSTGAQFSDHLRVTATDDDEQPVAVIVPARRAGITHADDWDGIGQRHTGSGTTVFDDVAVARDEVVALGVVVGVDRARGGFVQLYLHAIAAGILRSLAADAADVVRRRPRTYTFAASASPPTDPQLLAVVGELDATAFLAAAAVAAAAAELAHAVDAARVVGIDPDLETAASLAAARVKVALEEPALRAASRIFDVGGASSVRASAQLDRHWRNLRTLFSHNPTVYKARVLGDVAVNGSPLPPSGFF